MAKAQENDKMDFRPVPTTTWERIKIGMKCTESKILTALTPVGLVLSSAMAADIMGAMVSGRINPSIFLGGMLVGLGVIGVVAIVGTAQKVMKHSDRFAAQNREHNELVQKELDRELAETVRKNVKPGKFLSAQPRPVQGLAHGPV